MPDLPDTACVAGCYRCLLSYYNQPEHELLDRRDEHARRILWRLTCSETALAETAPPQSPSGAKADMNEAKGGQATWQQGFAAETSGLLPPVAAEHAGSPLLHWPDHQCPSPCRIRRATCKPNGKTGATPSSASARSTPSGRSPSESWSSWSGEDSGSAPQSSPGDL